MQYMLIIYHDENVWSKIPDSDRVRIYSEYRALADELGQAGIIKAGGELTPTSTAVTLRVRDGKALSTKGPFQETMEQLAGFFLIECNTIAEALSWAERIPSAKMGSIEVRQVSI